MNNLMSRKKKYRFQVELRVEELQHVPFLCQELYVKVRLLSGGFVSRSQSLMVENHSVRWNEVFKFGSKMTANASTGELDSCICRVSVRQEMKGGRAFQKLGYADVNLAQFPGSGGANCYLLEAYDSKHRLHNSTLRVAIDMTLLSGDPCFKAQAWPRASQPPIIEGPTEANSDAGSQPETGSVGSLPSLGYNSLDKKSKAGEEQEVDPSEQTGHSRNSSNTSGSGYVSNASHSDKSGHARTSSKRLHNYFGVSRMRRAKRDPHISSSGYSLASTEFASVLTRDFNSNQCRNRKASLKLCSSLNSCLNSMTLMEFDEYERRFIAFSLTRQSLSDISNLTRLSSSISSISRSGSQGSGGTYSEGGSLERGVATRGKSSVHSDKNKDPRVVSTREDAHDMIDQIFQDTIGTIKPDDSSENSGLQLYIRQDGTAAVSGHIMRPTEELKPIIISKR